MARTAAKPENGLILNWHQEIQCLANGREGAGIPMTIQMTLLEGGPASGGGSAWVSKGEVTPKIMGTLLHGRAITKFDLNVDDYKNTTAIISLNDGNQLQIYIPPGSWCRLEYYKRVNRAVL